MLATACKHWLDSFVEIHLLHRQGRHPITFRFVWLQDLAMRWLLPSASKHNASVSSVSCCAVGSFLSRQAFHDAEGFTNTRISLVRGGRSHVLGRRTRRFVLVSSGSAPILTTGQLLLHSCLHFLGLHLSADTMAILVSVCSPLPLSFFFGAMTKTRVAIRRRRRTT